VLRDLATAMDADRSTVGHSRFEPGSPCRRTSSSRSAWPRSRVASHGSTPTRRPCAATGTCRGAPSKAGGTRAYDGTVNDAAAHRAALRRQDDARSVARSSTRRTASRATISSRTTGRAQAARSPATRSPTRRASPSRARQLEARAHDG
jgi:hypothetical protein